MIRYKVHWLKLLISELGSRCGTDAKAVAPNTRDIRFSSRLHRIYKNYLGKGGHRGNIYIHSFFKNVT